MKFLKFKLLWNWMVVKFHCYGALAKFYMGLGRMYANLDNASKALKYMNLAAMQLLKGQDIIRNLSVSLNELEGES